jgi:hypothetical protein
MGRGEEDREALLGDQGAAEHHELQDDSGQKKTASDYDSNNNSIFIYGIAAAACYSLTYFWRYAIFVLPRDVLEQSVFSLGGAEVDLQAAFSLALTMGFGLAKLPAVSIMSSHFFFKNRFLFLLALLWISMSFMAIGTSAFYHVLIAQILCVFLSCFFSSWIYGGLVTYLEGRTGTEALLATMNFFYIYAGNASRGTGSLLLANGVAPSLMPMLLGVVCCPISSVCLYVANRCPPPSQLDVSRRSVRLPLSPAARWEFLRSNALGIACLLVPYALLSALRAFRDFYAQEIFTASLGRTDDAPAYVYFTVDLPGALLSCFIQYLFHYCQSNVRAFVGMLLTMCCSVLFMLFSTVIYDSSSDVTELSGFCWQVTIGIGLYVAYAILGTAAWDRLISLLEVDGTCTFLVFMADGCGYVGTTALLLYQTFGTSAGSDDDHDDHTDENEKYLDLFILLVYFSSVVMICCLVVAGVFFVWKSKKYSELSHFCGLWLRFKYVNVN